VLRQLGTLAAIRGASSFSIAASSSFAAAAYPRNKKTQILFVGSTNHERFRQLFDAPELWEATTRQSTKSLARDLTRGIGELRKKWNKVLEKSCLFKIEDRLNGGKHASDTMAIGRPARRCYRIDAYARHLMRCPSLH
jgi:hypothetical protein